LRGLPRGVISYIIRSNGSSVLAESFLAHPEKYYSGLSESAGPKNPPYRIGSFRNGKTDGAVK